MSVRVEGIRKEQIEIEVTPEALLRGLQEHFGIVELFNPRGDNYWSWSEDGSYMQEMEPATYHGSPKYRPTGRKITDENKLAAYASIRNLKSLLEVNHE